MVRQTVLAFKLERTDETMTARLLRRDGHETSTLDWMRC